MKGGDPVWGQVTKGPGFPYDPLRGVGYVASKRIGPIFSPLYSDVGGRKGLSKALREDDEPGLFLDQDIRAALQTRSKFKYADTPHGLARTV